MDSSSATKAWERDRAEFSLALREYGEMHRKELERANRYLMIALAGAAALLGCAFGKVAPWTDLRIVPSAFALLAMICGAIGWRSRLRSGRKVKMAGLKLWMKARELGLILCSDGTIDDSRWPVLTRSVDQLLALEPQRTQ